MTGIAEDETALAQAAKLPPRSALTDENEIG